MCKKKLAQEFQEIQMYDNTRSGDKDKKCHICQGDHLAQYCKSYKKTAIQLTIGVTKLCGVCDQEAHTFKSKDSTVRTNTQVSTYPKSVAHCICPYSF